MTPEHPPAPEPPTGAAMAGSSIALMQLTPFLRVVEQQGSDFEARVRERGQEIVARWGLSVDELEADHQRRIPIALGLELLSMLREMLDDPGLGLRAGATLQTGDYEVLEYLCGSCDTLRESIACLTRFYPLLADVELELVEIDDTAELRLSLPPDMPDAELLYEFATVSNLVMAALHLHLENIEMPVEFRFRHARPAHGDLYAIYLPSPVRFGCEHYATVFKASTLEQPLRTADPILHQVLLRQAEIELAALPRAGAFTQRVREAIEAELLGGADLEGVAGRLHLSGSNLRRRLREHGCTFSELLEATRREQAQLLLRDAELTVAEIAHRLGFAHPPAFHRAFKRWFGRSVKEYREWIASHHSTRFWSKRTR